MSREPFSFDGKPASTYGELGERVVEIAKAGDSTRATRFMDEYTDWLRENAESPQVAADPRGCARANVGYLSGYYGSDTAKAIREVFEVRHPIFGTTDPSPDEALAAGEKWGKEARDAQ